MVYCGNCGNKVDENEEICPYCHKRLEDVGTVKTQGSGGEAFIDGLLRADALIVVLILVVIPLLLYFISTKMSEAPSKPDSGTESESGLFPETVGENYAGNSETKVEYEETEQVPEHVTILDPALKYAVQKSMGAEGREITVSEAREVTSLKLSGAENDYGRISDLTGLSAFKWLREIDLSDNLVADLSELSGLENLTTLELEKNRVSDLTPLKNLKNLRKLDLYINEVSDITAIEDLTDLEVLDIRNNNISDINAVRNLKNLRELYFGMNHISDVSAVSGLTSLTYLSMGYNQIADISMLGNLKELRVLVMPANKITDISIVTSLDKLYHLEITDNPIRDYSPLARLSGNVEVDVDY